MRARARTLYTKTAPDLVPRPSIPIESQHPAAEEENKVESALSKLPETLTSKAGGWLGGLTKVLAGFAILIALSEIPNAGKTIVQPFQNPKNKDLSESAGQEVSDEIIADLGEMSDYFKFVVVGLQPGSASGAPSFRAAPVNTGIESGGADAVGNANTLSLPGGFKVPVNTLLLPIQGPMRWMLGVRVINGSIHRTAKGYSLRATSSDGGPWSETSSDTSDSVVPDLAKKIAF